MALWYKRRFNLPVGSQPNGQADIGSTLGGGKEGRPLKGGGVRGAAPEHGGGGGEAQGGRGGTGGDAADETRPQRYFLNFEAVDHECAVWVNGQRVGGHRGGFAPWRVEVTAAVGAGLTTVASAAGTHEVVVRVVGTDGAQLRGKQAKRPKGIWYTGASGIWQTVWVEAVARQHVEALKV